MKADKGASRPLLQPFWCRFDGSPAGRQDRMPHIKSYTRFRCATAFVCCLLQITS